MRKIIFIVLILFIVSTIFAEVVKEKKPLFVVSPTIGFLSGVRAGVGYAKISDEKVWEHTLNYQNELISHAAAPEITNKSINSYYLDSIYYQANRFWNSSRTESFLILKAGATLMPAMGIAMGGIDTDWAFPILAIGYGYSWKFKGLFLRPSIHLGIQLKVVNLEFAIVY